MNGKFRKIVSYLLVILSVFSFIQFKSVQTVYAAPDKSLIPEITINKGGKELLVRKVAGQYRVDYIDTTIENDYVITSNEGWTITDIDSDDPKMEKKQVPSNGKNKYIFNVGNPQGGFKFIVKVTSDDKDNPESKTYSISMNYTDSESLRFSKIVVSDANDVLKTSTVYYDDDHEDNKYKTTIGKESEKAKIQVYDSYGNVISKDIKYNGSESNIIDLSGGDNLVTISILKGANTIEYQLVIIKQGEALLKSLQPSAGELDPGFDSNTFDYNLLVPADVEKINFVPESVDNSSTITVDGIAVMSGRKSQDIKLDYGENKVTIVLTTPYGDISNYIINVERAEKETSTLLEDIEVSDGEFRQDFNSEIKEYDVSVENDVSSITITPTAQYPEDVKIKINGVTIKSGLPSSYINLDEGPNTVSVKVENNETGKFTMYILKISRKYSENNVNLNSLSLTSGKLSPLFDPETYLYSATVDRVIEDVRVKFTCQNEDAQVFINDKEYKSGQQSDKIKLDIGANLITIKVVAADGTTTTSYKISVIRGEIEGKNDWVLISGNWTFYNGYGTQIKNDWVKYDNKWYRLDVNGYIVTGWFKEDTDWYFLRDDGIMLTGWHYEKGYWYYFHENGKMAYDKWYYLDGHKYYFNALGEMQTGWQIYKGHWYYLGKSGVMQKGWITYDKNKYYLNDDGTMKNGWIWTGKTWYYLDDTGKLVYGWQTINGHKYYFDSKGAMKTGIIFLDGQWVNLDNL